MKQQSILTEEFETSIPCLPLHQPIGDFFIATIDHKTLVQITYSDVRRMADEDRQFEQYLGIQRPLSPNRTKEIAQYVNTIDACFPTAIILAIDAKYVEYRPTENRLVLRNFDPDGDEQPLESTRIAKVLDGQHRIAGLQSFNGPQFDVNVSIFVDMDVESQAYVFSTVNLAQTKVNKSLVYDLFDLAKARSPQKTCHKIAVALNSYDKSPFHNKIKRLGTATHGKFTETLTQATFVEALIGYLTEDKVSDRDLYRRHKKPKMDESKSNKLIFRSLFIQERDIEITDILFNYFSAVAERWPTAWTIGGEGLILNKTNGFRALMRFLKPAYLRFKHKNEIVSKDDFLKLFNKIDIEDHKFTPEYFKPGTSGESNLYRTFMSQSGLETQGLF
ncbi:DGQHR domain-containing protein [Burkholderia pseudomallei]|uniref:DGQHR domain-containing protein n=1 Tax=Burkholderia pseudomallei TaxID=28450 RepID=UPI001AD7D7E7|nr:DGQHR domain-containing protein [Burkholderia pseudomallei]MBO7771591.1 DGQHR domain-containing protein [Burkholderia pseudomallei]MBO7905634.1 DGQHR domain-containing protein [Burkholderia pseudomallei]